LTRDRV